MADSLADGSYAVVSEVEDEESKQFYSNTG